MDPNVTVAQSEPDQDNSSLQNPSTNPAEAGTTDETRDEDHETSSIEALNWSEVEEEELAAAQQALAAASAAQGKSASETTVNAKTDKDDETVTNNGSSTTDEGNVLSTSLLQSINSCVSDEDPQARKLSVIENWASEVTNAVERGEIEMAEDFPDENGTTGDDEDEDDMENKGLRKRKGKITPEMVSSVMTSASNGESSVDPLSNAPVLDDGPIWNKGPRSYTFQENRRINQKLTFCLLIAVVLAIGLGLGNLVAHQECEAEYKATQQSQVKLSEKSPVHTVPTTTTPAPIIPDRSTDSSMMSSSLPKKQPTPHNVEPPVPNAELDSNTVESNQIKRQVPADDVHKERRRKMDEPIIDPKYKAHAETVSNVVHTLDRLSREIDQFENTTRKLQGVLMISDEEKIEETKEEPKSLFDEEVHREDDVEDKNVEKEVDLEKDEDEMAKIEDLIDAIEQTPNYLEMKMHEKRWKELDKTVKRSQIFMKPVDKNQPRDKDAEMIVKYIEQFKEFERRFIKKERKRLKDEGKYDRLSWRFPEEYTLEEKKALQVRYNDKWEEYIKLAKNKVPDPIETLFGSDEDEEERTYGELMNFPFPDPDADLTDEETEQVIEKNFEEFRRRLKENPELWERGHIEKISSVEQEDDDEETSVIPESSETEGKPSTLLEDDLIIAKTRVEQTQPSNPSVTSTENESGEANVGGTYHDQTTSKSEATTHDDESVNVEPSLKYAQSESTLHATSNARDKGDNVGNDNKESPEMFDSMKQKADASNYYDSNVETSFQEKSQYENAKRFKREQAQTKEQKYKQGKQKVKNGDNGSNASSDNYDKLKANKESLKMSSKGKKLKNLESNKVFENIEGKMGDKRRGASPETQSNGKFREDTKHSEMRNNKYEKNSAPHKKSSSEESTKNKKNGFQRERGDILKESNYKQKVKHAQNDNQKPKYNIQDHDFENQDPENTKSQKQRHDKENRGAQRKSDFASDRKAGKTNKESQETFGKDTHFQKQKEDAKTKQHNHNNIPNSDNYHNGKRSKSWQNKEKTGRREKSRDNGSSWGN